MTKSLEDDMYDIIAKDMAREIDEGIMSSIYLNSGWTAVEFYFDSNDQAVDINLWLNKTCKNNWRRLGRDYLFKHRQDAEWFILRWL